MTFDAFKTVNFNVGQEVRAADLNDVQQFAAERLFNQVVLDMLRPTNLVNVGLLSECVRVMNLESAKPIRGGANNKVKIQAGTVYFDTGGPGFTFLGTEELTFTNGDGSHPRVDLVQLRNVGLVVDDSQTRVFAIASVKALLDMATVTTHFNTKFRAKAGGRGGDTITIRTVVGGAAAYSESGYNCTFTYVDGTTTVGVLEALAALASSNLIEIDTPGTGATVLHAPADTVGATHLAGGEDEELTSQSFNMKWRLSCILEIKTGTPAVSPVIPDPDSGARAICAVVIPTGYTWTDPVQYRDGNNTKAVLLDLRFPVNVKQYSVDAREGIYEPTTWVRQDNGNSLKCNTATTNTGNRLLMLCPVNRGRLIGVLVRGKGTHAGYKVCFYPNLDGTWGETVLSDLGALSFGGTISRKVADPAIVEGVTPSLAIHTGALLGVPTWCTGSRSDTHDLEVTSGGETEPYIQLGVFLEAANNLEIFNCTFIVAEGM